MKNISVITCNQGKFKEIKNFFDAVSISSTQIDVDLDEIQDIDPIKVINHKVQEAIRLGYTNFILEDTALYINGLNHLPGPLIKWFLQELGVNGIRKLAHAMGNGTAHAETIIAYVDDQKQIHFFTGRTEGTLVKPRGNLSFGWSALFQPEGSDKTYGEMTYQEKVSIGQRIKALNQLLEFLRK